MFVKPDAKIISFFKLETAINTTNMVAFDENIQIKKFESAEEILYHFYKMRLEMYKKRKEYIESELEKKLEFISEKARFIKLVIDGVIVLLRGKRVKL